MLLYDNAHLPGEIAAYQTDEEFLFGFHVPAPVNRVEEDDGVCGVLAGILFVQDHVRVVERSPLYRVNEEALAVYQVILPQSCAGFVYFLASLSCLAGFFVGGPVGSLAYETAVAGRLNETAGAVGRRFAVNACSYCWFVA